MTQNTPTIYQRLEKLEGELQKLTNTVYALKVTDIQNYDKNFEELSVSAALRAERIACQMRNLVCPALSPKSSSLSSQSGRCTGNADCRTAGDSHHYASRTASETKSQHNHCISP